MPNGGTARSPCILSRWSSCMFDCLSLINGTKHVLPAPSMALGAAAQGMFLVLHCCTGSDLV